MDTNNTQTYQKATFIERLLAYVIDFGLMLLISIAFAGALGLFFPTLFRNNPFSQLLFFVFNTVYNVITVYFFGKTLGKHILKLRVVSTKFTKVPFINVILRESIGKWISNLFAIGYLWVLIDKKRQGWHDKIANTYVVKTDKNGNFIPAPDTSPSKKSLAFFISLILIIILPFTLAIFVFSYLFLIQPVQVKGSAMDPNYLNNQYYLTDKISIRFRPLNRGDVVVHFANNHMTVIPYLDDNKDIKYLKRIIGLPGEKVTIQSGKVYIDNKVLDEPYIPFGLTTDTWPGGFIKEGIPVIVPEDSYFVLGDNRPHSSDSREFGFIPKENITGKLWLRYF